MTKDKIISTIIAREGGYVNNPADKGGATNYGITEAVARAHGYNGAMIDLTKIQARAIYEADYWYGPRFDQVNSVSTAIAEKLCDIGVNMGPAMSSRFLQRSLTLLNQNGKNYPNLSVDGQIGPRTISALKAFLAHRGKEGEAVLMAAITGLQVSRYMDITESRPANEAFLYGWLRNRVVAYDVG